MSGLTVIIPACNEQDAIGACLQGILASEHPFRGDHGDASVDGDAGQGAEIIVVPNGCTDRTAEIARSMADEAATAGWQLRVMETPEGGKINALNMADGAATFPNRVYLDADVVVSPRVLRELAEVLTRSEPVYASGSLDIARAESRLTRSYAAFWSQLPFVAEGVPGCGLFAVNGAGRARWGAFPDIISDDTFVRVHFSPDERIGVPAYYRWPMVEGFSNLVRVRRRQDVGVGEIASRYPELMHNEAKTPLGVGDMLALLRHDPIGFAVYALVSVAVRLPTIRPQQRWARDR